MPQNTFFLDYNVVGADRKRLVEAISDFTGADAKYLCAPSFAYEVDRYHIDKAGRVSMIDHVDGEEIRRLVSALKNVGFVAQNESFDPDESTSSGELDSEDTGPEGLTIVLPPDGFHVETYERLTKLIDSKAGLIRKALNTDRLTVQRKDDAITFPWWDKLPSPEETKAYVAFISALCKMALEAKRVTAIERDVESEKYAFRAFLLRLGFIGAESKETRKQLLKNLTGSTAFPNQKKADAFFENQKAKRDASKEATT